MSGPIDNGKSRRELPERLGTAEGDAIARLIRELAMEVEVQSPLDRGFEDDVLLDVSLDGVRCLLLRLSTAARELPQNLLSPREIEIARMVAKGLPNKTIAAVLEISTWTVGTHMRRVFAKLRVGSRAAMVARLAECGMIESRAPKRSLAQVAV